MNFDEWYKKNYPIIWRLVVAGDHPEATRRYNLAKEAYLAGWHIAWDRAMQSFEEGD